MSRAQTRGGGRPERSNRENPFAVVVQDGHSLSRSSLSTASVKGTGELGVELRATRCLLLIRDGPRRSIRSGSPVGQDAEG